MKSESARGSYLPEMEVIFKSDSGFASPDLSAEKQPFLAVFCEARQEGGAYGKKGSRHCAGGKGGYALDPLYTKKKNIYLSAERNVPT